MNFKKCTTLLIALCFSASTVSFAQVKPSQIDIAAFQQRAEGDLVALDKQIKSSGSRLFDQSGREIVNLAETTKQMIQADLNEVTIKIPKTVNGAIKEYSMKIRVVKVDSNNASMRILASAFDSDNKLLRRRSIVIDPNQDFSQSQIAIKEIISDLKSAFNTQQFGFLNKFLNLFVTKAHAISWTTIGTIWIAAGLMGKPSPWMVLAGVLMIVLNDE